MESDKQRPFNTNYVLNGNKIEIYTFPRHAFLTSGGEVNIKFKAQSHQQGLYLFPCTAKRQDLLRTIPILYRQGKTDKLAFSQSLVRLLQNA